MIPVDLNRLREAREWQDEKGWTGGVKVSYRESVDAVLDAPTVWWCADLKAGGKDEGTFGDGTCSICGNTPRYKGCGYAVVVPVKAGQQ